MFTFLTEMTGRGSRSRRGLTRAGSPALAASRSICVQVSLQFVTSFRISGFSKIPSRDFFSGGYQEKIPGKSQFSFSVSTRIG